MSDVVKLGVIGHPVSHSKSPLIHNYWIRKHGFAATYEALDIAPEDLEESLPDLVDQGYSGFNLTVPHKELAPGFCDEVDDLAKAVGAVNTITVIEGKLAGTNTDVFGFIENIKQHQPSFDFAAGPAVVLGGGGAAKAVVYGLLREGTPEIRVLNRTKEKAEKLSEMDSSKISVMDWEDRSVVLKDTSLLVNTTTLGMEGQPPLEIALDDLPQDALVNDIVYAPLCTDLLRQAQERGHPLVTGIGMLLHQARPAFAAWFGVMPEVDETLEREVLA